MLVWAIWCTKVKIVSLLSLKTCRALQINIRVAKYYHIIQNLMKAVTYFFLSFSWIFYMHPSISHMKTESENHVIMLSISNPWSKCKRRCRSKLIWCYFCKRAKPNKTHFSTIGYVIIQVSIKRFQDLFCLISLSYKIKHQISLAWHLSFQLKIRN